jgi:hypothetical protein
VSKEEGKKHCMSLDIILLIFLYLMFNMLNTTMSNYSNCIGRSSENICSNSGGAEEKGKTG